MSNKNRDIRELLSKQVIDRFIEMRVLDKFFTCDSTSSIPIDSFCEYLQSWGMFEYRMYLDMQTIKEIVQSEYKAIECINGYKDNCAAYNMPKKYNPLEE